MSNRSFSRRAVALLGAAAVALIIVGVLLARSYLFGVDRCNAELRLCIGEASSLTARADCYIELYHCRSFQEYRYPE